MTVDPFASWLRHGRDAGNDALRARIEAETAQFAARLLDAVPALPSAMLDIGSGEGLVPFAAAERWPGVQIIFTDISQTLLASVQRRAAALGLQARFLQCRAARLEGVADGSQNLVTARAALAYEADKPAAFAEIFRVLAPGGWLSIAEPVFREDGLAVCALRRAMQRDPNPLLKLLHKWKSAQFPDDEAALQANPLTSYTEREMLQFARQAGFTRVHLELHIDTHPALPRDWDIFCGIAPHPFAPSLGQIMQAQFSPEEHVMLEAALRPEIEAGAFQATGRMLYLSAQKPD